jgi:uncharacterized protein (DUF2249 family)
MKTATVTYVAPIGDNKATDLGGLTFFDGKSVEINDHDHPHLFNKLQTNGSFNFTMGKDAPETIKPPVKRGRPSNIDKAAAAAAAAEAEQAAKAAQVRADDAKATHEAILKEEGGKPTAVKPLSGPSIFAPKTDTTASPR